MACLAKCHLCNTTHIIGYDCPTPLNLDDMHKETLLFLKRKREHEEWSRKYLDKHPIYFGCVILSPNKYSGNIVMETGL